MPRRRPTTTETRTTWLGRAVAERRLALGLDQQHLADLAGCSRQFVSDLERGHERLTLAKVLDVCDVVGLRLTTEQQP